MKSSPDCEATGCEPNHALTLLESFLIKAQEDPRLGPVHITIYMGLWKLWRESGEAKCGISFFSFQLLPLAKVASYSTYHKVIKELHAFGYIEYTASYNRFKGSNAQLLFIKGTPWKQEKVSPLS